MLNMINVNEFVRFRSNKNLNKLFAHANDNVEWRGCGDDDNIPVFFSSARSVRFATRKQPQANIVASVSDKKEVISSVRSLRSRSYASSWWALRMISNNLRNCIFSFFSSAHLPSVFAFWAVRQSIMSFIWIMIAAAMFMFANAHHWNLIRKCSPSGLVESSLLLDRRSDEIENWNYFSLISWNNRWGDPSSKGVWGLQACALMRRVRWHQVRRQRSLNPGFRRNGHFPFGIRAAALPPNQFG